MRKRSEPVFETDETPEQLRSRSDARRERLQSEEELMMLSEALVSLGDGTLQKLDLGDSVLSAIFGAKRVAPGGARNRALRLVRASLRDLDVGLLREVLEDQHGVSIEPAKLRKRDRPR
ncbi:MAG TPA: DUF615 domain-containing protein [Polyangiaceae bacterium]|nr:DUF615 domain-containing protein [Polyangiaceae bacterium]